MEAILQAAKLEIVRALGGELTAERFSNVIRIARWGENIANQEGRPDELIRAKTQALEETEFRVPTLHEAILADLTSGNDVIMKKYKRLQDTHVDLEQRRLVTDAARVRLEAEREALHQERLAIRQIRDALMLEADRSGRDIPELPALPPLPPHPLDDEGLEQVAQIKGGEEEKDDE